MMQTLPKWAAPDRKEKFAMFGNTFPHLANRLQFNRDDVWGGNNWASNA